MENFIQKSVQFVYEQKATDNNFDFDSDENTANAIDLDFIAAIINTLIAILQEPMIFLDKEKCSEAFTQMTRLSNILTENRINSNNIRMIIQTINDIMAGSNSKKFSNLVNEYFYSNITPKLLGTILKLIYAMMQCQDFDFFMDIFTANFIDDLATIIDNPENGNKNKFMETIKFFENANDNDYSFDNDPDYDDNYNSDDEIAFEKEDIFNAREYSCKILYDFLTIYLRLDEEKKEYIGLPSFSSFYKSILNGVFNTTQEGNESAASQYVLQLLLLIIDKFISMDDLDIYTVADTFVFLIDIAKNPSVSGMNYALSSLFCLNSKGFLFSNFYDGDNLINILKITTQSSEYSHELMAFVHSIFFSKNDDAKQTLIDSIKEYNNTNNYNLMNIFAFNNNIDIQLNYCNFCYDLLNLLFIDDEKDFYMKDSDLIIFFDSIGMINNLMSLTQDTEYCLRRKAIHTILDASSQFNIDIIHRLITNYNLIETFIEFISLDFKIFSASLTFVNKILTVIEKLKIIDAKTLLTRLIDNHVFDEIENSIQEFDINNLYKEQLNQNNQKNDNEKEYQIKYIIDTLNLIFDQKNKQINRLFSNKK